MIETDTPEYLQYYADQKQDTLGAACGAKYLDYLTTILPNFDYVKSKILDVGCGAFDSWDWFVDRHGRRIQGCDIGDCVKDILPTWPEGKRLSIILPADAHRLTSYYPVNTFDMALAFHSLEHMFDMPTVLQHIYSILKVGGYFYFSLPMPSYNWHRGHWYDIPDQDTMLKYCTEAGFSKVLHNELVSDLRFRPQQEMVALVEKQ